MNRSLLALLAAGTATLVISGAAMAGTNAATAATAEPRSVRVSYSDLDLRKEADAARLYARLRHAAEVVCDAGGHRDARAAAQYQACFEQALGEAVAAVGSAKVTSRYLGTTAAAPHAPAA